MHLMIDLETLATSPDAVIMSADLVFFDLEDKIIYESYASFCIESQLKSGRRIDGSTLLWWQKQSEDARRVFIECETGHKEIAPWIEAELFAAQKVKGFQWKDLQVWGNGALFDVGILEDVFRKKDSEIPWKFWNVFCFRTFDKMTKARKKLPRSGVHHNALDDARYQTECVLNVLTGGKK